MKNGLIFIGGVITGIVLTILVAFVISGNKDAADDDMVTYFDKPGETFEAESLMVIQVIKKDAALVLKTSSDDLLLDQTVYLLTNKEGKYYYDGEFVNVPKGKVLRHIGICRYENKEGTLKTVPIVRIIDK